jgi:hypothetical protein
MMRRFLSRWVGVAAILCAGHGLLAATIEVVVPATKPSRPAHFNWEFKSANGTAVQRGQFACGSYWVAPAEGDDGVTLMSLTGNPAWKDLLSCDADPVTEKHGLLSGKNKYGSHDPAENVLDKLPMAFKPQACVSLVAAMQRDEEATSKGGTKAILGEVADAYCVVTVMARAPRNGGRDMIRPNITGATKEFLTWDDLALERLPKHDFLKGKTPEEWEKARIRWSHSTEVFSMAAEIEGRRGKQIAIFSEGGRAFRSMLLVHDYASGVARAYNGDVMALLSAEGTLEEQKPALAAMLSYGLDIYHARYDRGTTARKTWSSGAGQAMGQFLPPVLLAALQKDPAKAEQLKRVAVTNHGEDPGEWGPQELRQLHRGVTGVLLWGDGHPILRPEGKMVEADWRYWADFTASKCYDGYEGQGNPNLGKKTATDPYGFIDGPANKPGTSYMGVAFGGHRSFAAVMLLVPEVRRVVNTDMPIEYVDRVVRHGLWTWPDPVAAPAKGDRDTASVWWSVKGAAEWGKTWGVRPDDVRLAIEDGKGRFRSLHGKPLKGGYEAQAAAEHWEQIVGMWDGERFEKRAVGPGEVVAPEILFAGGDMFLSCPTPDAVIRYTLDGGAPGEGSAKWDGKGVKVTAGAKIKAVAEAKGKRSVVREATAK